MSMLARFRKPGGFLQLLNLIETCEPVKRNQLMDLIAKEDPGWAHLVKTKALSFERIMAWPQNTLMEITPRIPDKILGVAVHMCPTEFREKLLSSLPHMKRREIEYMLNNFNPSSGEKHAAVIKIIQTVRELEHEGMLKMSMIDPSLVLDQKLAS